MTRRRRATAAALMLLALAGGAFAASRTVPDGSTTPPADSPSRTTFRPDDVEPQECSATDHECAAQAFGNVSYRRGPRAALRALDAAIGDGDVSRARCHGITHRIGEAAIARNPDLDAVLTESIPLCSNGFEHGAVAAALSGNDANRVVRSDADPCAVVRDGTGPSPELTGCVHGLGHVLTAGASYELVDALRRCDRATADDLEAYRCHQGAIMELDSMPDDLRSTWRRPALAAKLCVRVPDGYRRPCYRSARRLPTLGVSWAAGFQECRRHGERWVADCVAGIARAIGGDAWRTPARIARLCGLALELRERCMAEASIAAGATSGRVGPRGAVCQHAARPSACMQFVEPIP